MIGYCNASGIGLIPWSPLATGKLARPLSAQTDRGEAIKKRGLHEGEAEDEIVRRVEEVAKKKGWPMAQVAIAWSMSKVISPIIGINSVSIYPASYPTLLMRRSPGRAPRASHSWGQDTFRKGIRIPRGTVRIVIL